MNRRYQLRPEAVLAAREVAERRLTAEEFAAWADGQMGDAEREELYSLIDWFTRRYPTPLERLVFATRMDRQLRRSQPLLPR